jgi:hypothetical protein
MLLWTTHGLGSVSEAAIGFTSWLGPSTTPTDVDSAIRSASGRAFTTIAATAMVLDHDPSIMRTGIEIREVSEEWRLRDRPRRLPHSYTLQALKRNE